MAKRRRTRRSFRRLIDQVARNHPRIVDPERLIVSGMVLVDGSLVTNPASWVRVDASIVIRTPRTLRGARKLRAALRTFGVAVAGRVGLDVGAAAGGFTSALLQAAAEKVYAVDAGYGQLSGELRSDPRVVNLERTNLGDLDRNLVPSTIDMITMDLSYLSITSAVPQLEGVAIASDADLVVLVKPTFELALARPPSDELVLQMAVHRASVGLQASHWRIMGTMESPIRGRRGAVEFFLHASRSEAS